MIKPNLNESSSLSESGPSVKTNKKSTPLRPFLLLTPKTETFRVFTYFIILVKRGYDKKNFTFDKVFSMNSNQEELFESSGKRVVEVH